MQVDSNERNINLVLHGVPEEGGKYLRKIY